MGHTANGQPQACPVCAVLRRVAHLNLNHAPCTTPLHIYYTDTGQRRSVTSAMITSMLQAAA